MLQRSPLSADPRLDSEQEKLIGQTLDVPRRIERDIESFQTRKALEQVVTFARAANR